MKYALINKFVILLIMWMHNVAVVRYIYDEYALLNTSECVISLSALTIFLVFTMSAHRNLPDKFEVKE